LRFCGGGRSEPGKELAVRAALDSSVLLGSTNLINWTPLSTNPAPTNVFNVYDPDATNFPTRFYLLLQQ